MLTANHVQNSIAPDHLHMVDNQLRTAGVFDLQVIQAFLDIPRIEFIPPSCHALAYSDAIVPLDTIGAKGRALMLPLLLGKILQAMGSVNDKNILIVGGGTGYSASLLCSMKANVTLLETPPLAQYAHTIFSKLKLPIQVIEGGLLASDINEMFDLILIEGRIAFLPEHIMNSLHIGGKLFTLMAFGPISHVTQFIKTEAGMSKSTLFEGHASLLPDYAAVDQFIF